LAKIEGHLRRWWGHTFLAGFGKAEDQVKQDGGVRKKIQQKI
jgi:hypothetical protein